VLAREKKEKNECKELKSRNSCALPSMDTGESSCVEGDYLFFTPYFTHTQKEQDLLKTEIKSKQPREKEKLMRNSFIIG